MMYYISDLKIYYDEENWNLIENYQGSLVTFFLRNRANQISVPCITIFRHEKVLINLTKIFENTQKELERSLKGYKDKVHNITENEIEFSYTGESNGVMMELFQKIYKVDNKIFSVTYGCAKEYFEKNRELFSKVKIKITHEEKQV